jgi:hypothetical protein
MDCDDYTGLDAGARTQVTWVYATTRPMGYFYLAGAARTKIEKAAKKRLAKFRAQAKKVAG